MTKTTDPFSTLTERSRDVFRTLVQQYIDEGDPVGSRTLTRALTENISAATVRNVMQDLEHLGLLDSPHTSAGRVPTQYGMRMFVDSLLEIGDLPAIERKKIEKTIDRDDNDMARVLDQATSVLSGLSHGAGLVLAPKSEAPIKQIEFVLLSPDRAMVVLVTADGQVENRIFAPPPGQTPTSIA